jgi:hypothetical protein
MPLPRGRKNERLGLGGLEHNTTQLSCGCRVLRSGGQKHINHRVHHVHLELTTKRLKAFPAKEPQQAALERLRWKCRKTTSTVLLLVRSDSSKAAWRRWSTTVKSVTCVEQSSEEAGPNGGREEQSGW